MKRIVLAMVLGLLAAGCGPSFKDEFEELDYLKSLSNPTPAQWKRRKEIEEMPNVVRAAEWKAEREGLAREAREAEADGDIANAQLKYWKIESEYPNTKEGEEAKEAKPRLKAKWAEKYRREHPEAPGP